MKQTFVTIFMFTIGFSNLNQCMSYPRLRQRPSNQRRVNSQHNPISYSFRYYPERNQNFHLANPAQINLTKHKQKIWNDDRWFKNQKLPDVLPFDLSNAKNQNREYFESERKADKPRTRIPFVNDRLGKDNIEGMPNPSDKEKNSIKLYSDDRFLEGQELIEALGTISFITAAKIGPTSVFSYLKGFSFGMMFICKLLHAAFSIYALLYTKLRELAEQRSLNKENDIKFYDR
ncbi:uncharacterized protein LOC136024649 [Artemia franciscana]|uniref:uncharacterized protein LOC136024649 n=1 Tax=Artemia franciscana TaxID=6661 RepID=UPI0032DBA7E2